MKLDVSWEIIEMNSILLGNNCGKKLTTQGLGPLYVSESLTYEQRGYWNESLTNSRVLVKSYVFQNQGSRKQSFFNSM